MAARARQTETRGGNAVRCGAVRVAKVGSLSLRCGLRLCARAKEQRKWVFARPWRDERLPLPFSPFVARIYERCWLQ